MSIPFSATDAHKLGMDYSSLLDDALSNLCARDPVIALLAQRHGPPALERSPFGGLGAGRGAIEDGYFADLVDIVIHQQLAGKAAVAIAKRFSQVLSHSVTPRAVLDADPFLLRAQGLSNAKLAAINELAREVDDGKLDLDDLSQRSDEAVVERISMLRGFGPWSAQMFLMFSLKRFDVWPANDLGVRKGYRHSYGLEEVPRAAQLLVFGERFKPYRSLVAWYMWRSLEEPSLLGPQQKH